MTFVSCSSPPRSFSGRCRGYAAARPAGPRSESRGCSPAGKNIAVMVATFAFLPPRDRETLTRRSLWRRTIFLIGLLWLFVGFFGYLRFAVGPGTADAFIDQFLGPKAPINQTLETSFETLLLGMGAWAILACLVPRVAILGVALDLGPVQRAVGDAVALHVGMARSSVT